MLTSKKIIKILAVLMVVSLLISACDRPLPSDDNPTSTIEAYPDAEQENAGANQEEAEAPEPTRAVVEEGESTGETASEEEGGEAATEAGEETAETAEETTTETEAEGETAETEEMAEEAEVTTEEGEAETTEETSEAETTEETASETGTESETTEAGEAETTEETTAGETEETESSGTESQPLPATHTVAAGENLYRIGLQYGLSWVAIAEYNHISNPNQIYAGQVLEIPGSGTGGQPEPVPPAGINYVVKPGDTLYKIGKEFGVTWTEIAEANGIVNPNQIYAGQTIKIPVEEPSPPTAVNHVVQPGETLYSISVEFGVPWMTIAQANHIRPPFYIYSGQTLVIPGGQP